MQEKYEEIHILLSRNKYRKGFSSFFLRALTIPSIILCTRLWNIENFTGQ